MADWLGLAGRPALVVGAGGLGRRQRGRAWPPRAPGSWWSTVDERAASTRSPARPRTPAARSGRSSPTCAPPSACRAAVEEAARLVGHARDLPARGRPQRPPAGARARRRRLAVDPHPQPVHRVVARAGGRPPDGRGRLRPDGVRVVGVGAARPRRPRAVRRDQGRHQPDDAGDGPRVGAVTASPSTRSDPATSRPT